VTFDCFPKERLGRDNIAPGAETKVHGSSLAIDRSVTPRSLDKPRTRSRRQPHRLRAL
jgi:hypothetical protein